MLNNVIKSFFSAVGALTGFTLVRTFIHAWNLELPFSASLAIYIVSALVLAGAFYFTANKFITVVMELLDKLERFMQSMTLYEITVSAIGLIVGLIAANLISIPVSKLEIIGLPISITANLLFGCAGVGIAMHKRSEHIFDSLKENKKCLEDRPKVSSKLLDTSVLIDGRIIDICRAGFIEGEIVIPGFVLEELRHIADSSDTLKRSKGRRGLDIVNLLQKEMSKNICIENIETESAGEVDDKLLAAAVRRGSSIMTVDYNLNKVANINGIQVLNINELANAVKPIALPGDEMLIQVIKDGKENGQGVGYLEDGTMIVVEGGKKHMGESINVMVTSVLQTAAGRMIFAKPKCKMEKATG
ncbi:MAG: TRAM domain-containing protein [Clostridia bacterium]|nr:TRAM domain-containing protein [Clostridia bacterium]